MDNLPLTGWTCASGLELGLPAALRVVDGSACENRKKRTGFFSF
jgi:hypothetical protein